MGIGLRKIPQQPFGFKINILTEKPEMIAVGEQLVKEFFGPVLLPDLKEAVDKPEGTNSEGGRRQAKIVFILISVQ